MLTISKKAVIVVVGILLIITLISIIGYEITSHTVGSSGQGILVRKTP